MVPVSISGSFGEDHVAESQYQNRANFPMTNMGTNQESSPADTARALIRESSVAALATHSTGQNAPDGPWPYVSLVTAACDLDGTPILLLSDLAEHSKNIAGDPRLSLLFTGTPSAGGDPLARGRVTVLGRAERTGNKRQIERFLARHEEAKGYASFRDFHFYRVEVSRAHLVAGFGSIHWIEASALLYRGDADALANAEGEILAHMNADHGETLALYAERLLGLAPNPYGSAWRMTGIDPEGLDLQAGGMTARLGFDEAVMDPEAARAELVRLAKLARFRQAGSDSE
jgi:heme oxygenase (biliverdin-IX-beta and delta-forming)